MKFSVDELFEILLALTGGLHDADWGALAPPAERERWVAEQRESLERRLADPRISAEECKEVQWSLATLGDLEARERRQREGFFAEPEPKRRRQLSGYKQAVNDVLSQSRYFTVAQRVAIDRRLAQRSLPNLRRLEMSLRRKHTAILKRGRIRNDEEYYIVQEILADVSFDVTDAERAALSGMAVQFEQTRS